MMKKTIWTLALTMILSTAYSKTGNFFNIIQSGIAANVGIILCLNGEGPLTCQIYDVSQLTLTLHTVTPNHFYPAAGIKVVTPGFVATNCTPYINGFCLFSVSDTIPATVVIKRTQTITFTSPAPTNATVSGFPYTPTAVATSGLPVVISVDPSSVNVCTINGIGAVNFIGAGICTLNANQAGNVEFAPAPQAQQSFTVTIGTPSLSVIPSPLVLAQNGIFTVQSGAPVGPAKSRVLTISNNGLATATNLITTFNPSLTGGTTTSTTCTGSLPPGAHCTVTINPGNAVSGIGSPPATYTFTAAATDSNPATAQVLFLTYGSLYQDGYVFSIDDSTPATSSVGLVKVAATMDQNDFIPWDADPACATPPFNCTFSTLAISKTDGLDIPPGNTFRIWNTLTNSAPFDPPTFPEAVSSYAAGICHSFTGGGFTDWYLPAICEMSYASGGNQSSGCGMRLSPMGQNMQANLVDINYTSPVALSLINGGNAGTYWSSTENAANTIRQAWYQVFVTSPALSNQFTFNKGNPKGVRCTREFLP